MKIEDFKKYPEKIQVYNLGTEQVETIYGRMDDENLLPILFSIHSLNRLITLNGESFIPLTYICTYYGYEKKEILLFKINEREGTKAMIRNDEEYKKVLFRDDNFNIAYSEQWITNILRSWYIDVDKLIESGEAIDSEDDILWIS